MKRISLFLTTVQLKALATISKRDGLSVAEHIRRAIDSYLSKKGVSR